MKGSGCLRLQHTIRYLGTNLGGGVLKGGATNAERRVTGVQGKGCPTSQPAHQLDRSEGAPTARNSFHMRDWMHWKENNPPLNSGTICTSAIRRSHQPRQVTTGKFVQRCALHFNLSKMQGRRFTRQVPEKKPSSNQKMTPPAG